MNKSYFDKIYIRLNRALEILLHRNDDNEEIQSFICYMILCRFWFVWNHREINDENGSWASNSELLRSYFLTSDFSLFLED